MTRSYLLAFDQYSALCFCHCRQNLLTSTTIAMAEGFIGLTVIATLCDPSGVKVRGEVTDVEAGQLTLSKGKSRVFTADYATFH